MFLSCIGLMGKAGGFVGGALFGLLGLPAYVFPFLLFGFFMFAERILEQDDGISKMIGGILLILAIGLICEMSSADLHEGAALSIKEIYTRCSEGKNGGGIIAGLITFALYSLLRTPGTILVIIVLILVGVTLISRRSISAFLESQAATQRQHLHEMAEQRRIRREERALYEDEYDDYDDYPEQDDAGAYYEDDYSGYEEYPSDTGKGDQYYDDAAAYEKPYPQKRRAEQPARKETAKDRFRRLQEESRQRRLKKQEEEALRAEELENQQILRRDQHYSGVTLDTKLPNPDEEQQAYAEGGVPGALEGEAVGLLYDMKEDGTREYHQPIAYIGKAPNFMIFLTEDSDPLRQAEEPEAEEAEEQAE